ncbi:MAG: energy-coupling factor ABC transporter ATP-binding protein [Gammaproteobacteria bacterium]
MSGEKKAQLVHAGGITKSYGGRAVLDIGELTITEGDSIALTGENGSGKTTLLKILAGLLPPDGARRLLFDGKTPYPRGAPMVSYLHQTPHLFAASVRANVEYGLRRMATKPQMRAERAVEAMQWAGVFHLADMRADKLSGGEQRRTALARIRALQPRLYLLDEPAAHLDAESTKRTAKMLIQLRGQNATIITAGHPPFTDTIQTTRQWHLQNGKLSGGFG